MIPPLKFPFTSFNLVHGGGMYASITRPAKDWNLLVQGTFIRYGTETFKGEPHYGLIEGSFGKGKIVCTQIVAVLSFVEDRSKEGKDFFENLINYFGILKDEK